MELAQEDRHAERDDPGIETHTDPAERFSPHASDDPAAQRYADRDAGHNERNESEALTRDHAGREVRHRRQRRFGEPHQPEGGAELAFRQALIA